MNHFTSVKDVTNLSNLTNKALEFRQNPHAYQHLGVGKTLGLIFFNPSLRTRISMQKAAQLLGLSVIVMNIGSEGWKLEFEEGTVMDGPNAEHVKDAAAVMGQYCNIIGIRAFASLNDAQADYQEKILTAFKTYAGVPIISLESATRHPLQSLADHITICTYQQKPRPKVVLSWAPHPKALPQAVANSFIEWMQIADVDLWVTHPKRYELAPEFAQDISVTYDQMTAFEQADFIYAKNWSSYNEYGQVLPVEENWTITTKKMKLTNEAYFMHCLPIRRNIVAEDSVLDHPNSLIIPQAGNRVVAAQAVLYELLLGAE